MPQHEEASLCGPIHSTVVTGNTVSIVVCDSEGPEASTHTHTYRHINAHTYTLTAVT